MMLGRRNILYLLLAASACGSVYRDRSPATSGRATTIVGRVTPDGALLADTLAGVHPDTSRVDRETTLTGQIRAVHATALQTGYRVQVHADRDAARAANVARRVEATLAGEPVYVEWIEPWYKVRVGDYAARTDAEPLRLRLAAAGYADAWIVQTTIRTEP